MTDTTKPPAPPFLRKAKTETGGSHPSDPQVPPFYTAAPAGEVDPFLDLSALRLDQSYSDGIGVEKVLMMVPVRKPGRQDFVRVHGDESHRLQTNIIEIQEDRESYLVAPHLWAALVSELIPVVLYETVNRQGVPGVWPVRLPGPDGKENMWHRSAHDAASLAMRKWTRVTSNMSLKAYEAHVATGVLPEPSFPNITFGEILKIAFRDRFITSLDHPVVARLTGRG